MIHINEAFWSRVRRASRLGFMGGAAVGCGGTIWAAIYYVQPAIAEIDFLSEEDAWWVTGLLTFLGGIELATVAGGCAGSFLFGVSQGVYDLCSGQAIINDVPEYDVDGETSDIEEGFNTPRLIMK